VKLSRLLLFAAIMLAGFAVFEAGLRLAGGSEAAPEFQQLFAHEPGMTAYRLRPGAKAHYKTPEFETDIAINSSGVRDREIPPKPPGERRIVVLGDSLVLSVQVQGNETFCSLLEKRLNARRGVGDPTYRVINAGVQGYGPVEELEFYQNVASRFEPDVVLVAVFVGNDAMEASDSASRLPSDGRPIDNPTVPAPAAPESSPQLDGVKRPSRYPLWFRRLTRRSMVLQILRLRATTLLERFGDPAPIDRALTMYLPFLPVDMARGLAVTRDCVRRIADAAARQGARTGIVLVPARFQVEDDDYGRLKEVVEQSGTTLVRDAGTDRFRQALAPLNLPMMDALPVLRDSPRRTDTFFKSTVHLTVTGHDVMAEGLEKFVRESGLVK
jgi:lysophospholipase L1-like esterase